MHDNYAAIYQISLQKINLFFRSIQQRAYGSSNLKHSDFISI